MGPSPADCRAPRWAALGVSFGALVVGRASVPGLPMSGPRGAVVWAVHPAAAGFLVRRPAGASGSRGSHVLRRDSDPGQPTLRPHNAARLMRPSAWRAPRPVVVAGSRGARALGRASAPGLPLRGSGDVVARAVPPATGFRTKRSCLAGLLTACGDTNRSTPHPRGALPVAAPQAKRLAGALDRPTPRPRDTWPEAELQASPMRVTPETANLAPGCGVARPHGAVRSLGRPRRTHRSIPPGNIDLARNSAPGQPIPGSRAAHSVPVWARATRERCASAAPRDLGLIRRFRRLRVADTSSARGHLATRIVAPGQSNPDERSAHPAPAETREPSQRLTRAAPANPDRATSHSRGGPLEAKLWARPAAPSASPGNQHSSRRCLPRSPELGAHAIEVVAP